MASANSPHTLTLTHPFRPPFLAVSRRFTPSCVAQYISFSADSTSPVRDQYCPGCVFNMSQMGDPAASGAFRKAMADVLFINRSAVSVDSIAANGYLGGSCIGGNCNSPQIVVTFTVTVLGMDMDAYLTVTALTYAYYEAASSASYNIYTRSSLIAALSRYNFPRLLQLS